jgi:hypothetical protein
MVTEHQREQNERRRIIEEEARAHNGDTGNTYLGHTHLDDEGGRFAVIAPKTIIGSTQDIAASYPACAAELAVQLPDEPPLSAYENPALDDPSAASLLHAEQLGAPVSDVAPPSGVQAQSPADGVETTSAGAPPSSSTKGSK